MNRRSFLGSLAGAVAAAPLVTPEPVAAVVPPAPAPVQPPGFLVSNLHTGARVTVQAETAQEAIDIAAKLNRNMSGGTWAVSAETAQEAGDEHFGEWHGRRYHLPQNSRVLHEQRLHAMLRSPRGTPPLRLRDQPVTTHRLHRYPSLSPRDPRRLPR